MKTWRARLISLVQMRIRRVQELLMYSKDCMNGEAVEETRHRQDSVVQEVCLTLLMH